MNPSRAPRPDRGAAGTPAPQRCLSLRQTLRGAACLSVQPLALNILSVPVLAYVIRRLGPDGYAQWMTAATLLAVCGVVTNPGLRGAFVRQLAAEPGATAAALAEQLGLRLLLTVLAGVLVLSVCLGIGYPAPVLWCTAVGAVGLALTTVASTFADLLQSFHRLQTLAGVNLGAGLTLTGASVMAAYWAADPVLMAAAYLTGPAASAAALLVIVRRQICPVRVRFDARTCGALLVRSRFFAAQQLLWAGSAQAEALMLPVMIRMSQFGFFSAGAMIPNRLSVLPDALCTAAYPGLVKASTNGARAAAPMVSLYLAIAFGGSVLVALAVSLAAAPIGGLLFPAESMLFITIIRITVWCLPLAALELVLAYALNAAGRDAAVARASLPAAVVSLLVSIGLISGFGVIGACWSMLLRPGVRAAFLAPIALRTFYAGLVEPEPVELPVLGAELVLRKAG